MKKVKAAFLDRDGTINTEKGYINHPSQIELIPGSARAVKMFNDAGYRVFGISNQSGVARGYFPPERVLECNARVMELLESENARLEEILFCPHHPQGSVPEWTKVCGCRKPQPGMVRAAAEKYGIALGEIVVVGDKVCDVELGKNVGARTALVATGYGREEKGKIEAGGGRRPDFYAEDLLDAARQLLDGA